MRTKANATVMLVALLAAVMPLGMSGGTAGAQSAAGGGPPTMDLRWTGHSTQQGIQGSYCWQEASGAGLCVEMAGDSHKAMWVRSGSTLKVRIHHPDKPQTFDATTARRVEEDGTPRGEARDLDVTLRPVRRDGATRAWDALFTVGGERHHHIYVFATWPQGDASWRFHVKTVR
jgi:hypothetical protein